MSAWHCSGFLFKKIGDLWYSLGITDVRCPNDVKPVGGSEEAGENPEETLMREFAEETNRKMSIRDGEFVKVHRRNETPTHEKIFHLITKVEGDIGLGEILNINDEGESLITRWWKIDDFHLNVHCRYADAFREACIKMAELDKIFAAENASLLEKLCLKPRG